MKNRLLLLVSASLFLAFSSCSDYEEPVADENPATEAEARASYSNQIIFYFDNYNQNVRPEGGPIYNTHIKIVQGETVLFNDTVRPFSMGSTNGILPFNVNGTNNGRPITVTISDMRVTGFQQQHSADVYVNYVIHEVIGNNTSTVTMNIRPPFTSGSPTIHVRFLDGNWY